MKKEARKLLLKLGLSTIKQNWKQFLAIVGIGGLAINLFVGLLTNASSFEYRVHSMHKDGNVADVFLTLDPRNPDPNDLDKIQDIAAKYGYSEERFYTLTGLSSKNALCAISYSMPSISAPSEIIKSSPKQTNHNFFIIDEVLCESNAISTQTIDFDVGKICDVTIDTSYFSLSEEELNQIDVLLKTGAENPFRQDKFILNFEITGIMKHPENISRAAYSPCLFMCSNSVFRNSLRDKLAESFTELGLRTIWREGFEGILNWGDGNPYGSTISFPTGNQFLIKLYDKNNKDKLMNELETYFSSKAVDNHLMLQAIDDTSGGMEVNQDIKQSYQLAFAFPLIFFLVAILIILTTFRQLILKDRNQIGTLKGLGFKNKEIYLYYFLLVGAITTISFLIGAVSGPFLIPFLLEMKYKILYTLPRVTIVFPWFYAFLTWLAFIAISILITWYVSRKEIKLKPVESMRPKEINVIFKAKRIKKKKTDKANTFKLATHLAFRNMISDPVKSLMVLLGMIGCTALLCCGFGIEDTINKGINNDPFVHSGANMTLAYVYEQENSKTDIDFKIEDDEGELLINGYQPYSRVALEISHNSSSYSSYIQVMGEYRAFQGDTNIHYSMSDLPKDSVYLSSKVARKLSVKVNDTISFEYSGQRIEAKVSKIYDAFYANGIMILGESTLFSEPITKYEGAWLNLTNKNNELVREKLTDLSYVGSAETPEGWAKIVNDAVSSISIITNAVKVFALLLATIALYNLGLMNFNERIREIATMKVLGFKKKEVSASLLIETLTLTFVGAAIGLTLGMPFMVTVLTINEVGMVDYIYTVTTLTYIFSFLFTFLVGVLINGLLMLKIRGIKMIESLKSVE